MQQSRKESFLEQTFNVGSGFFLAVLTWEACLVMISWGWFNYDDTITITSIFTVVSFVRGYFWRRFFNAKVHRLVHEWLSRNKNAP